MASTRCCLLDFMVLQRYRIMEDFCRSLIEAMRRAAAAPGVDKAGRY
jgi:hypothetical protein